MSLLYLCADLVYELLYLIVGKVDAFLLQQFFDARSQIRTFFGSEKDSNSATHDCSAKESI